MFFLTETIFIMLSLKCIKNPLIVMMITSLVVLITSGLYSVSVHNNIRIFLSFAFSVYLFYRIFFKKNIVTISLNSIVLLSFVFIGLLQLQLSNNFISYDEKILHAFILITYLSLLLIFILSLSNNQQEECKNIQIKSVVLLQIILFISLLSVFLLNDSFKESIDMFFENIRILNNIQAVTIPFLFLVLLQRNIVYKTLAFILLSINIFILIESTSRAVILSLLLSYFIIYLNNKDRIKSIDREALVSVFLIFTISVMAFLIMHLYLDDLNSKENHILESLHHTSGRLDMWKEELKVLFLDTNIFQAIGFASESKFTFPNAHPHNIVLFFMNGLSVFFGLFFISHISYKLFLFLRKTRNAFDINSEYFHISASVLTFFFVSLFSGIYFNQIAIFVLMISISILQENLYQNVNTTYLIKLNKTISMFFLAIVAIANFMLLEKSSELLLNKDNEKTPTFGIYIK